MPSGGGSGGGGSSGAVDYPTYMKTWHAAALGIGVDGTGNTLGSNIADVIDAKIGNSPFAALTPYDPASAVATINSSIADLKAVVDAFAGKADWGDIVHRAAISLDDEVFGTREVDAEIAAFNAIMDAEVRNVVLPRFRRGMQDINAVSSSAFVVGQALIESSVQRDKAKYAADLRLQNHKERAAGIMAGIDEIVKLIISKIDMHRVLTQSTLEANRLAIIAFKEETDQDIHLSELDGRWDLEVWNYAGNMMASIGAASVRTGQQTSPMLSALGAGMAGVGALIGMAGML